MKQQAVLRTSDGTPPTTFVARLPATLDAAIRSYATTHDMSLNSVLVLALTAFFPEI